MSIFFLASQYRNWPKLSYSKLSLPLTLRTNHWWGLVGERPHITGRELGLNSQHECWVKEWEHWQCVQHLCPYWNNRDNERKEGVEGDAKQASKASDSAPVLSTDFCPHWQGDNTLCLPSHRLPRSQSSWSKICEEFVPTLSTVMIMYISKTRTAA